MKKLQDRWGGSDGLGHVVSSNHGRGFKAQKTLEEGEVEVANNLPKILHH